MEGIKKMEEFSKGGPYIGPRGGKWADAAHTIPWDDKKKKRDHQTKTDEKERGSDTADVWSKINKLASQAKTLARPVIEQAMKDKDDYVKKHYGERLQDIIDRMSNKTVQERVGKNLGMNQVLEYARDDLQTTKNFVRSYKEHLEDKKRTEQFYRELNMMEEFKQPPKVKKSEANMTGIDKLEQFAKGGDAGAETDLEKGDYGKSETTAVGILEEFCKSGANGLPTNEPKLGSGPEEGGKVEGVGKTSGSGDAPSVSADAPKPKVEKLSDDDEVDEDQVKPHKKPVETRKSLDLSNPNQRLADAAHANAMAVSQLQKSSDIQHGVGIPTPAPAQEPEVVKHREWTQGPQSLVHYSDASDRAAVEMIKSNSFYTGGSPELPRGSILTQTVTCPACKGNMSKSLTACPGCGYGTVASRVIPGAESKLEKSAKGPSLRPARRNEGLYLPNGIVSDNE